MVFVPQDYENFISYVCKAYKGTDVPKSCSQVFFDAVQMVNAKPKHSVCDKETVMPNLWEQLRLTITSWMPHMNVAGAIQMCQYCVISKCFVAVVISRTCDELAFYQQTLTVYVNAIKKYHLKQRKAQNYMNCMIKAAKSQEICSDCFVRK